MSKQIYYTIENTAYSGSIDWNYDTICEDINYIISKYAPLCPIFTNIKPIIQSNVSLIEKYMPDIITEIYTEICSEFNIKSSGYFDIMSKILSSIMDDVMNNMNINELNNENVDEYIDEYIDSVGGYCPHLDYSYFYKFFYWDSTCGHAVRECDVMSTLWNISINKITRCIINNKIYNA